MQPIKPKLGNAAALFTDTEHSSSSGAIPKNIFSKQLLGRAAGMVAIVLLVASVFIFQTNHGHIKKIGNQQAAIADEVDDTVAVVAKNESGELVGTLVRLDTESDVDELTTTKPTVLSEQERKKLLEIINNE